MADHTITSDINNNPIQTVIKQSFRWLCPCLSTFLQWTKNKCGTLHTHYPNPTENHCEIAFNYDFIGIKCLPNKQRERGRPTKIPVCMSNVKKYSVVL